MKLLSGVNFGSSRNNSAPKERHNLAHGVRSCEEMPGSAGVPPAVDAKSLRNGIQERARRPRSQGSRQFFTASQPWVRNAPSLSPSPLPPERPLGKRRVQRSGVRAFRPRAWEIEQMPGVDYWRIQKGCAEAKPLHGGLTYRGRIHSGGWQR